MSICCDIENSFAPATSNRVSEFQILVNLYFPSRTNPLISLIKILIFPSGIKV